MLSVKSCISCGESKPIDDYYVHPQMGDGRLNKCKECCKVHVRANRALRLEYYREYDRDRTYDPKRVAMRRAYAKSERAKEIIAAGKVAWSKRNPEKYQARCAVNNALRDGRLKKKDCELCGLDKSQAHHEDYSRPLDIIWLCAGCHSKVHKYTRIIARLRRHEMPGVEE